VWCWILHVTLTHGIKHHSDKHQNEQTRRLFYRSPTPHARTAQFTPDRDHDTPAVSPHTIFFSLFPTGVRLMDLIITIRTPPRRPNKPVTKNIAPPPHRFHIRTPTSLHVHTQFMPHIQFIGLMMRSQYPPLIINI